MAVVEGIVTLDGEPLPGVRVAFSPVGGPSNPTPGPRSAGTTNDLGEFRLVTRGGLVGAVTGKHRVRLTTRKSTVDEKNPLKEVIVVPEKVPSYYRRGGVLDTTIPPEGIRDLTFDLTSDRRR